MKMDMTRLYKYLDVNGGLAMLKYHNLQFTNASKFNDPFDCHPALFDYSYIPKNKEQIIKVAKKLNPNIKIYQMTTDPEAFRLKAEQI